MEKMINKAIERKTEQLAYKDELKVIQTNQGYLDEKLTDAMNDFAETKLMFADYDDQIKILRKEIA